MFCRREGQHATPGRAKARCSGSCAVDGRPKVPARAPELGRGRSAGRCGWAGRAGGWAVPAGRCQTPRYDTSLRPSSCRRPRCAQGLVTSGKRGRGLGPITDLPPTMAVPDTSLRGPAGPDFPPPDLPPLARLPTPPRLAPRVCTPSTRRIDVDASRPPPRSGHDRIARVPRGPW